MGYITTLVNDVERQMVYIRVQGIEEDTLTQLQKEVGGYVDVCNWLFPELNGKNIDCWIADEGYGKPLTVTYLGQNIRGNLVFAKHDGEGETIGLSPDECIDILEVLKDGFDGVIPVQMLLSKSEIEEWQNYLSDFADCAQA